MPTLIFRLALLAMVAGTALSSSPPAIAQVRLPGNIPGGSQIGRDTVPSVAYFNAIERMYKGNYNDAERSFGREIRSSIKIGVAQRWLDSIAYHTMLGEVYYLQGRMPEALDQFDQACLMFLQDPNWLIRVDFRRDPQPDVNSLRQPLPWGKSTRQFTLGRFPTQELIGLGSFQDVQRVAQEGGTMVAPQYWQLDVLEIVRTTAWAIRRRNELLGPLGAQDTISRELVTALSRGTTTPNHWSKAWADLQLGLAQVGVGNPDQAVKFLERSLLVMGRFDHPLTGMAMLELGRLKMEAGDLSGAANLLTEASYSAFYYDDLGTIDEAFRLITMNHLASGPKSLNPLLEPAAAWAGRKRYDHLAARLSLALAEESLHLGNAKDAQATLSTGQARLGRDAARGLLANWSQYLAARLQFLVGRDTAISALSQAVAQQIPMSTYNLQLYLANKRYDQQQLQARSAVEIYQTLLADPQPADWILRPFETLASLQTPRTAAYDRWLDAVLARKDMGAALEITDLAKRHRFHSALAWGGRLAALRDTLETPEHLISQHARNQRNELLLRFPKYDVVQKEGQKLRDQLSKKWQPGIDASEQSDMIQLWRAWDKNLNQREAMLGEIGLQRAAVDMRFPPVLETTNLQQQLQPGQALVVFHETPAAMLGFLVTSEGSTHWQCAPKKRLDSYIAKFLRDLGNYDANHQLPMEELQSTDWHESGAKLYDALLGGSSLDPAQLKELIVVPDGVVWYVPFAALPLKLEDQITPLISSAKVRQTPTAGLAVGYSHPWRRVLRSAIVGNDILPGESEERAKAMASLRETLENPLEFPESTPAPTPVMGSLCQTLVVLNDIELDLAAPLAWSPIAERRNSKETSLSHWLTLPEFGPQRIVLPAARNVAERGGRISNRKSAPPGTEMFLATCGLMSSGAQTILLSSWRVGGDATLELTREFLQEVPFTTAAASWQRSVQLARELPMITELQPRIKSNRNDAVEITAAHPFFWAGYTLIDTGAPAPTADAKASPVANN